jgi:hypothetical protein
MPDDAERRQALDGLRQPYNEARDLVSGTLPHENLEWILGAKRNLSHGAANLNDKTIEVVALWLEDLAFEVDGRLPPGPTIGRDRGSQPPDQTGHSVAARLRLATLRFVTAFRRKLAGNGAPHQHQNPSDDASL